MALQLFFYPDVFPPSEAASFAFCVPESSWFFFFITWQKRVRGKQWLKCYWEQLRVSVKLQNAAGVYWERDFHKQINLTCQFRGIVNIACPYTKRWTTSLNNKHGIACNTWVSGVSWVCLDTCSTGIQRCLLISFRLHSALLLLELICSCLHTWVNWQ